MLMATNLGITILMIGLLVMIVIFLCSMCYSSCWFWCNKRYRKKSLAKEEEESAKRAEAGENDKITLENMTEKFLAKGITTSPFYSVEIHCREQEQREAAMEQGETMELSLVQKTDDPTAQRAGQ